MTSNKFMVYPHGFVGARLISREPPTPSDMAEKFGAMLTGDGVIMPESVKPYNKVVENLTRTLLSGSPLSRTFDFREKILKTALTAFGSSDIGVWYAEQYKSAEFGDIHQRFLDDCFRFIMTGERELVPEYWYKILSCKEDRTDDLGSVTRAAFGTGWGDRAQRFLDRPNKTIQKVICEWTAQKGGHEDMLLSMNILFGA